MDREELIEKFRRYMEKQDLSEEEIYFVGKEISEEAWINIQESNPEEEEPEEEDEFDDDEDEDQDEDDGADDDEPTGTPDDEDQRVVAKPKLKKVIIKPAKIKVEQKKTGIGNLKGPDYSDLDF